MSLASLLGDDEHTAKDDAYARAMKSRKWVMLSAAACIAVWSGFFSPIDFSVGVGKMSVAAETWRKLTSYGLMYASFQYVFLIIQLAGRYQHLLRERFGLREVERAMDTQRQIEQAVLERSAMKGDPRAQAIMVATNSPDHFIVPGSLPSDVLQSRIDGLDNKIAQLQALADSNPPQPAPNTLYQLSEVSIDFIRLGVPALTAVIAFWSIFRI